MMLDLAASLSTPSGKLWAKAVDWKGLVDRYGSQYKIMAATGLSRHQVRAHCWPRAAIAGKARTTWLKSLDWHALYQEHGSTRKLAAAIKVSRTSVISYLIFNNVTTKKNNNPASARIPLAQRRRQMPKDHWVRSVKPDIPATRSSNRMRNFIFNS